ncbi:MULTISPECIES: DUF4123 domain-containing protein [Aeromonas]|uniref:DUF4123 domain-containing protein n=1 Tax=Aeromonas bestiarum TaxID=105751 RepID=A0ABT7Q5Q3_9GAMM|nr:MULTISPECIES: DUF4123 domain-containing protein [Aeromonas]EJN6956735.1 DUF4123 domain-containing protein [Aeromonas hydrophila]MCX0439109.1 DUF4123 domain-containing protein [Aeromonas veronii]MDM5074655.1 DUF4123 domain-containing protein [Aeromonas bestiarum]UYB69722.1 DUF4123 domain-containing protein [Aeromonas veronii]CAD7520858.1 type III secretion protein [Aeromonas hydrophila]
MTFQEWRSQYPGPLFAIVDAALDTTAVADYCNQGGTNAIPLFAGTAFADQAEQGPWLLPDPAPEFIAAHPQLGGVYVTSDAAIDVVHQHWQSLIEVAFEGEVMWLRYADNRVFPKMLATMSQQELDDVLGPCSSLWANDSAWQRTPDTELTPRQAPWFRVQPHHLAPLYDESRHAYILSRHFWQRMEDMMARHPNPEAAITTVLKQANQAGLAGDVLDGVVAGALTLQASMTLDAIRAPLMLTDDEMAQVNNWLNKHPDLIGAV